MSKRDKNVIHFITSTCEINPFSRSLPEMIENENAINLSGLVHIQRWYFKLAYFELPFQVVINIPTHNFYVLGTIRFVSIKKEHRKIIIIFFMAWSFTKVLSFCSLI